MIAMQYSIASISFECKRSSFASTLQPAKNMHEYSYFVGKIKGKQS